MAAHRKPRQRPLSGPAGRTAAVLALAGAATATAFEGIGQAEPRLTPAQVKTEVDRLYQQAEEATERYNGAKEKAARAQTALDALRDEAARRTARLNTTRDALGSVATAQYRSGGLDPALQLVLSSDPDDYLEGAALAQRAGDRQADTIAGLQGQLAEIGRLRSESTGHLRDLEARRTELGRHRTTVKNKIAAAEDLLARLTSDQRARYEAGEGGRDAGRADRGAPRGTVRAPNARAAQAVAYAYGALGKPYVWGATGPDSYDCSGLTQAAWRSAGVSLPRTTYSQIDAGQRVSRSRLAPGDLLFFYSGISHVGMYVGDGKMIHAPRPGAPVRVAPIDEMPWAGATRVG
ncbi:C40 family peptidase [Streptomyces sp. SP18CS02]|uniref:C40 family peptidase n=1 Tax=Streptomyces sp. SP18CS02 TaxID=3002531 RepID=UPI002E7969A4|nr:NlpC/P60 family protein [Streptomyces sp. SP18CS02]MEE1756101.1 NlpC/P60 family protein [Streptomyces sp. SP18CS02]